MQLFYNAKKAVKQKTGIINNHELVPVGVSCLVYNSMP